MGPHSWPAHSSRPPCPRFPVDHGIEQPDPEQKTPTASGIRAAPTPIGERDVDNEKQGISRPLFPCLFHLISLREAKPAIVVWGWARNGGARKCSKVIAGTWSARQRKTSLGFINQF